jgi:dihydropteroate synthase
VLGCRVLVGHSRKRFLNNVSNNVFANRDIETAVVSSYLAGQHVDYLRVHEYQELINLNNLNNNLGIR